MISLVGGAVMDERDTIPLGHGDGGRTVRSIHEKLVNKGSSE